MTGAEQQKASFGDKLAYLIETVHPPGRGPYSYREIAAGIADHPGAVTAAHINQLVKGKQPHPRIHHVEALASFFGVPVTYFFDEDTAAQVMAEYELVAAMRDSRIREICRHAPRLDQQGLIAITNLIKNLTATKDT